MNARVAALVCAALGTSVAVFACSGTTDPATGTGDEDSGAIESEPDATTLSPEAPTPQNDSGSHHADAAAGDGGVSDGDVSDGDVSDGDVSDGDVSDAPIDAASDASDGAVDELNGCAVTGDAGAPYVDKTAGNATRTITFSKNATVQPYSIPCMKIKATQKVTWSGSFGAYPLEAKGGTLPSPILLTAAGNSVTFTFNAAGIYGFDSNGQPAKMRGAIEVIP